MNDLWCVTGDMFGNDVREVGNGLQVFVMDWGERRVNVFGGDDGCQILEGDSEGFAMGVGRG